MTQKSIKNRFKNQSKNDPQNRLKNGSKTPHFGVQNPPILGVQNLHFWGQTPRTQKNDPPSSSPVHTFFQRFFFSPKKINFPNKTPMKPHFCRFWGFFYRFSRKKPIETPFFTPKIFCTRCRKIF